MRVEKKMIRAERYRILDKRVAFILGYIQLLVQQIHEHQLHHMEAHNLIIIQASNCIIFLMNCIYEGRSELQNGVIMSTFKTEIFRNKHSVGNLIGDTYILKFLYKVDVIIIILKAQSVNAVICSSVSLLFCNM